MESLPGVVCVFDSSGNIWPWNRNFLGYPAAEIMRTAWTATSQNPSNWKNSAPSLRMWFPKSTAAHKPKIVMAG
jgi:hypothetical protein